MLQLLELFMPFRFPLSLFVSVPAVVSQSNRLSQEARQGGSQAVLQ